MNDIKIDPILEDIDEEQDLRGSILSYETELRLRNKLRVLIAEKSNRVITKENIDSVIAENNYDAGSIAIIQLLLEESAAAKHQLSN